MLTSYGDNGESVYDGPRLEPAFPAGISVELDGPLDVDRIADDVVARIHADPEFAARVAAELGAGHET